MPSSEVLVELGPRSYRIQIRPGLLNDLDDKVRIFDFGQLFLVSDRRVYDLFGRRLISGSGLDAVPVLIPEGEQYKRLQTLDTIYSALIRAGADRTSAILALGGGVVGDIAGFAAATFMRGIPFVQIPTTLLAQVDSSVGGKTGVNHPLGKNLIGAFHQPVAVFADTETLTTLAEREFQSGLYEVIKTGLIRDGAFFDMLETNLDSIIRKDVAVLVDVVTRCCQIKAEVVSHDEREGGLRKILNLGHTFGHGLEAATDYRLLTHGEAVAYGMKAAAILSSRLGLLDKESVKRIVDCLHRVADLPAIDHVSFSSVREAMRRDKKVRRGRETLVLLRAVGAAEIVEAPEEGLLREVWEAATAPPAR